MKKFIRECSGTKRMFQILSVFLALCMLLTTVSVQRIFAEGPEKVSRDMLIPSSVVISDPTALSNVSLPQSSYGSLAWENGSAVPNSYEGYYSVIFKSNGSADLSGIDGYDAASGTLKGSVQVVVKNLAPAPTASPTPEVTAAPAPETEETPAPTPEVTEEPKEDPEVTETPSESQEEDKESEGTDEPDGDNREEAGDTDKEEDSKEDSDKTDSEESKGDSDETDSEESKEDSDETDGEESKEDSDKTDAEDGKGDSDKTDSEESKEDSDKTDAEDGKEDSDETDAEDGKEDSDKTDSEDGKEDSDKTDKEDSKDEADEKEDENPEGINDITDKDLKETAASQPDTADPEAVPQDQAVAAAQNHTCNGINVSADFLPWYVQFRVSSADSYEFANEDSANIFQSYELELWDLLHDKPYEIPAGKYVTVTIPVKEGYEYTIEHILSGGGTETIIPTVYGGTMVFSVDSFSPFGIAGSKPLVGDAIAEGGYSGTTATPTPTQRPSASTNTQTSSDSSRQTAAANSSSGSSGNENYQENSQSVNDSSVERTVTYKSSTAKAVQTGDSTAILPFIIMAVVGLAVIAAIIIIILVVNNKRRRK